jgi:hypothetical protein
MIGSSLLTKDQCKNGLNSLISIIEERYERKTPEEGAEDSGEDEECMGVFPVSPGYSPRKLASEEVGKFMKHYKEKECMPTFHTEDLKCLHRTTSSTISDEMISIGNNIKGKGKDLPSGRNCADYFDQRGKFKVIKFWCGHQTHFPELWAYATEIASANPTAVSCETLFSQSGYASNSRRTRLDSRQLECQTIIAHNLQHVFL